MNKKELVDKIIKKMVASQYKESEIKLVKKAIRFADKKHLNQKRKSGEPYIIHPLNVALNLINWNADVNSIAAGILHDVIEDTDATKEEVENYFNKDIANIVDTVTKVSNISKKNRRKKNEKSTDSREIDYHIKVITSITNDYRAFIVKLADRLHNMQTISYLIYEKQIKIAQETFDIYANIAGRIGLYNIKTMLQDLSFKVLFPTKYSFVEAELEEYSKKNETIWNSFSTELFNIVKKTKISFEMTKRIKGVFSISKKIEKGKKVGEINDVFANRIIINGKIADCYKILGLIHINFLYIPGTFKDYISSPKLNMYQSLHTTIKFENIFIEIQIRTKDMDYNANHGLASHWEYKEGISKNKGNSINSLITDLVKNKNELYDKETFKNIFSNKTFDILILNNNEWVIVNEKLTILDIAFKYSTNNFLTLSSIFVNDVRVNFNYKPRGGDIVKFNYSTIIKVQKEWLKYVTLIEAKDLINKYFNESKIENEVTISKFVSFAKQTLGEKFIGEEQLKAKIVKKIGFNSLSEFIEKSMMKDVQIKYLLILASKDTTKEEEEKTISEILYKMKGIKTKNIFYFNGLESVNYKSIQYPNCCSKVPPIECVAVLEERKKIAIHSITCSKLKNYKKRFSLSWNKEMLEMFPRSFSCNITFNCIPNYVNTILNFLSNNNYEIKSLNTNKINDDVKSISLTIEVEVIDEVYNLISSLEKKFNVSNIKII